MTPRPSEEARRALRAALAETRGSGDADPTTPNGVAGETEERAEETPVGGGGGPRPGDAAREALRRALASRRAGDASGRPDAGEDGADAPGEPADADDVPAPEAASGDTVERPTAAPAPRGEEAAPSGQGDRDVAEDEDEEGNDEAGDDGDEEGDEDGVEPASSSARPADIAREALRVARAEADRARTTPEARHGGPRERGVGGGSGSGSGSGNSNGIGDGGAGDGHEGAVRGRGRGDRRTAPPRPGADRSAAATRARELRELLAGAFQLPPEAAEDEPTAGAPVEPARTARPTTGHERPPRGRTTPDPPASDPVAPRRSTTDSVAPRRSTNDPADPVEPRRSTTDPVAPRRPADPGVLAAAPAAPASPRSMAAPGRDGELRRTFPALPARPERSAEDGAFAETWWGEAWVAALEEGALDANRLARGRGYAARGHVDAITVTPGLVLAYVQGTRPRPYRVQLRLRTLDDADWDRFLDAAAERPGHIAALLDKELPQSLADCGVPLLPGPGDLAPQCSCPDSGHPCKHAAALCYQTARLLDADPFVLLLLRGRGERRLLDDLSRLSAARAARAAQDRAPAAVPGVRAVDAVAPRRLPPLPAPLPPPPHPEQPPAYPAAPGGPDPFALDQLATDAAARAHALLTTGRDPVGGLTLWQDAVRLAAARPGSGLTASTRSLYSSLATATGRTPADLARAVAAWRQGGLAGLTVLDEFWDPPAGRFDRARPLLLAADLPAFRPWHNTLTHPRGHLQLRLGRDGLWYAYESEPGREDWWPRGTPDLDPVGALTGLGLPNGGDDPPGADLP